MNEKNRVFNFYKAILAYCNMIVDSEGYVYTYHEGTKSPKMIGGKRLVLPFSNQLSSRDIDDNIVFHPIPENIARGESDVIKSLLTALNVRLNYSIGVVMKTLYLVSTNTDQHKNLTPEQTEFMLTVGVIDKTALNTFIKIMLHGIKEGPTKFFTNIYLKRGGTLNGKRYSRVGIVRFPLYDEIIGDGHTVFGIKVREKDREILKNVYEYIFPNIEVKDKYSYGSDSDFIPYLESMLLSSLNIASKLNDVIAVFEDQIDQPEFINFNSEFFEQLTSDIDNIISEARRIPSQPGNSADAPGMPATQAQAPEYIPRGTAPATPQYNSPAYQTPRIHETERGLDINSIIANSPSMQNTAMAFGMNPMNMPGAMLNPNMVPMNNNFGFNQMMPPAPQMPVMNPNMAHQPWNQPIGQATTQPALNQWGQPMYPPMAPTMPYAHNNVNTMPNTGFVNPFMHR